MSPTMVAKIVIDNIIVTPENKTLQSITQHEKYLVPLSLSKDNKGGRWTEHPKTSRIAGSSRKLVV